MQRIALEVTDTVTGITTIEGATVIESAEQLEVLFASFGIETDDTDWPGNLDEDAYWDEMAADHGIEEYDDW